MNDPGPFRFFWANVIRKPCPDCTLPTAAGFDRHDPGARTREATRCTACTAEAMSNEAVFTSVQTGIPVQETGPCARCSAPHRRYGPQGKPFCDACEPAMARQLSASPGGPARQVPSPREPEPEHQMELEF